jgi:hypothetical protein
MPINAKNYLRIIPTRPSFLQKLFTFEIRNKMKYIQISNYGFLLRC